MDRWKKRALDMVVGLVTAKSTNPAVTEYKPQKTRALGPDKKKYFPRRKPESLGISSLRIYSMLAELESDRRANVHNVLVMKDMAVISEASHPGYSVMMPHLANSMSKTVTGLAVGMLVDDGVLSLDELVVDILGYSEPVDKRYSRLTVEHLLKMSCGSAFAEVGSVTEENWIEAYFSTEPKFAAGSGFFYNSMNSYLLAEIVRKKTGKTLTELLDERLFSPLHIDNYLWERSKSGTEKGGWGLFMSLESWAKIGVTVLQNGVFEGRRIISSEWLSEMCSVKNISDGSMGDYDYGYHVWVGAEGDILFNGMFGQNVWINPKNNIIVAINCGNNELFQRSPTLNIIRKYLGGEIKDELSYSAYSMLRKKEKRFFEPRHWIRPKNPKGILYRLGVRTDRHATDEWLKVKGEYLLPHNNLGMLPIFLRLMQNNLESGIDKFGIEANGQSLAITFCEAGVDYRIGVGIFDFVTTVLDFRGEKYVVSAIGEAIEDEDRNPVFKIELIFPELPNTRMIKITEKDNGRILIRMEENPTRRVVDRYLEQSFMSSPLAALAMGAMKKRLGENFISEALDIVFAPSAVGIRSDLPELDALMALEERERELRVEKFTAAASMIRGFIKDNETDRAERRTPLSILGSIFRKRSNAEQKDTAINTDAIAEREASAPQAIICADDIIGLSENMPGEILSLLPTAESQQKMSTEANGEGEPKK